MTERDAGSDEGSTEVSPGGPDGTHAPLSAPEVERLGKAALILAVAGTLGFPGLMLTFGGAANAISLFDQHPRREGVELVLFPLVVVAVSVLLPARQRYVTAIRASRIGPWIPLLGTLLVPGTAWYLGATWEAQRLDPAIGPARVLGAALIVGAAFAGAMLYPRLSAAIAGALAAPALFGLLALPFPRSEVSGSMLALVVYYFEGPSSPLHLNSGGSCCSDNVPRQGARAKGQSGRRQVTFVNIPTAIVNTHHPVIKALRLY